MITHVGNPDEKALPLGERRGGPRRREPGRRAGDEGGTVTGEDYRRISEKLADERHKRLEALEARVNALVWKVAAIGGAAGVLGAVGALLAKYWLAGLGGP